MWFVVCEEGLIVNLPYLLITFTLPKGPFFRDNSAQHITDGNVRRIVNQVNAVLISCKSGFVVESFSFLLFNAAILAGAASFIL
jgi:hypothetical protein